MNHLTPTEIVDVLDGALPESRRAHLADCPSCRAQVDAFAALVDDAPPLPVPEPSPLFWEHFSARVRDAIAAEPAPASRRWFAWPVLAPIGALAVLVLALGAAIARDGRLTTTAPPVVAIVASDASADDDAAVEAVWALASDLATSGDADVDEAALLVAPGSAERAAVQLNADERAELIRLLEREVGRSGG
jgi:hypothetical protein